MKKIFIYLFLAFYFGLLNNVYASCNCNHKGACNHHHTHHSSQSSSQPVYLVRSEHNTSEEKFPNCAKHYMKTDTTINYYSDGSRRTFVNSTVYNQDGTILVSNCNKVKHVFYKNSHYFIICKNSGCSIINSKGETITKQNYSKIEELKENRFLVKYNKKFGIIDIEENAVVPVKYQKFQKISDETFITKLNGYYGILDIENDILVKNDCEKIKPLHNTILLKRYGKYGLNKPDGSVIYKIEFDKIKPYKEFILLKKDKKYQISDYNGKSLSDEKFKKIKLERNTLFGIIGKEKVKITE